MDTWLSTKRSILLVALLVPAVAQGQEWTRFRGPNGTGISEAKTIPTEWTDDDINWKIRLPGMGHSSPVVWGDQVFVTVHDPTDHVFRVVAVDASDGRVRWQKAFPFVAHQKHDLNTFASGTPALDADRVYSCRTEAERITLTALTHEGDLVWEKDLGPFMGNHGGGLSPIVYGDWVVLANEQRGASSLLAVDAATGDLHWRVPRTSDAGNYSTPCVYEPDNGQPLLIFNSEAHGISAITPETGAVVWAFPEAFDKRSVSSPTISGDIIFGSCGSGGGGNYVVAVRAGTATREPERVFEIRRSAPYVPTGLCLAGALYLWSDGGIVSRVQVSTGDIVWQERVGGRFFSSPIWVDDRLFGISTTGEVVVLATGEEFKVLARNRLNETIHSTPAVSNGRLFIHSLNHLFSIGGPGSEPTSAEAESPQPRL